MSATAAGERAAAATEDSPGHPRRWLIFAVVTLGAFAAACGPPVGGVLVLVSWRLIFVVNLPLAVLALAAGRRIVPEVRHPDRGGRPDVPGILLLVAGIALIVLCIVKGAGWGGGASRSSAASSSRSRCSRGSCGAARPTRPR